MEANITNTVDLYIIINVSKRCDNLKLSNSTFVSFYWPKLTIKKYKGGPEAIWMHQASDSGCTDNRVGCKLNQIHYEYV